MCEWLDAKRSGTLANRLVQTWSLGVAFALVVGRAGAQVTVPPQSDPLMSLMMSQPPLDTTSPVRATAAFDPPVVRPGEPSTYRVSFNALEQFIAWPSSIAAPA